MGSGEPTGGLMFDFDRWREWMKIEADRLAVDGFAANGAVPSDGVGRTSRIGQINLQQNPP